MSSPIYMPLILCSDYKVIIRERERESFSEDCSNEELMLSKYFQAQIYR